MFVLAYCNVHRFILGHTPHEARGTTDDGRRTTDDGRRTTDDGRRTTDDGRRTSDDGRRTTDDGRRTADDGRRTTDDGRRTTGDGRRTADDGRRTTDDGRRTTDDGRWTRTTSNERHAIMIHPVECCLPGERLYDVLRLVLERRDDVLRRVEADGRVVLLWHEHLDARLVRSRLLQLLVGSRPWRGQARAAGCRLWAAQQGYGGHAGL